MTPRLIAMMGALVLVAGLTGPATAIADKRFKTWQSANEPQCTLVAAAKSGSSAALLATFEDMLEGRASRADVARAMKPLTKLVQSRQPVTANAYELFVLDGEISDALVIITFSGDIKLFTRMTLTKNRDGWSLLSFYYDANWDKIQPRLNVPNAHLMPIGCKSTPPNQG